MRSCEKEILFSTKEVFFWKPEQKKVLKCEVVESPLYRCNGLIKNYEAKLNKEKPNVYRQLREIEKRTRKRGREC